jgi:hypothetical protein
MNEQWMRVDGFARCSDCGHLVTVSWRLYRRPALWTLALCEPCTERRLAEPHRGSQSLTGPA